MIFARKFNNWSVTLLLALTVGLGLAWIIEPVLVGSTWTVRLLLLAGCLATTGVMFRLEMRRQTGEERTARRYIDLLCRLDHHDLVAADDASRPPSINPSSAWAPIFARIRDCLVDSGRRADELEHSWRAAEVRVRRLSDELARLTGILDGLSDPVLAINYYDELVYANRSARELLQLETTEGPLQQLIPCPLLVDLMTDTRRRKSPSLRNSEIKVGLAGGGSRWYRVSCRALDDPANEDSDTHGAVAVLSDIGGEKEIQKRHAEFVSAASHEMKTPLAGIRAYVELLADGDAEDEETREEFLNVIDTQADRLQRLIENLLNLARIEAGVVAVNKQQHSLNELLEQALGVVQPSAEQKDIRLVSDLSPMFLNVLADRDMLSQTAINLLSNAIKYTPSGGKVTLRSRMEDDSAVFEVEDTGVGLSDEDCQRVFEKFYRVKKDQQMAAGTGLGLPLAKHIAEDVHGGTLTATSQRGKGSVFRVSLPSHRMKV